MKKIGRTLAGVMLGAALATSFVSSPASANVAQGRFCEPVGSIGKYRAKYFYDGEYVGVGPKRFFRSTAWRDCNRYMF